MQRKTFTRSFTAHSATALLPLLAQAQAVKMTLGHGAAPGNLQDRQGAIAWSARMRSQLER